MFSSIQISAMSGLNSVAKHISTLIKIKEKKSWVMYMVGAWLGLRIHRMDYPLVDVLIPADHWNV